MAKKQPKRTQQQASKNRSKTTASVNMPWWKDKWTQLLIGGTLLLTCIVFMPALQNGFTNWDDQIYVTENPEVWQFTPNQVVKYFTTPMVANYHPFTMMSLAFDYQVSGLNPWFYHFHNIILHLINIVLVFLFVYRLTDKNQLIAGLTMVLFAIHPMHVESVAWVAERKDVLYALYLLGAFLAYLSYMSSGKRSAYFLTLGLFLGSLFSKPAAVPFPLMLLAIDFLKGREKTADGNWNMNIFIEKIPFFLLSIIFGLITITSQSDVGAIGTLPNYSIGYKFLFASYGFVVYILKFFVPYTLSNYHPYPLAEDLSTMFILAPLLMAVIIGLGVYSLRHSRTLAFGLLFYFFGVALVLQFVSVGNALIAERYTYVPYIGLWIALGYGIHALVKEQPNRMPWVLGALGVYVLACSYISFERTKVWKTSETLWSDVISKYPREPIAFYDRGLYYYEVGQWNEALNDFTQAIDLQPSYYEAVHNRGLVYRKQKLLPQALQDFNRSIELKTTDAKAYIHRGNTLNDLKRYQEALQDFNIALQLAPDNILAYFNRGLALLNLGRYEEALSDYAHVLGQNPNYAQAYLNRSAIYSTMGRKAEALQDALKAQSLGVNVPQDYLQSLQ